MKDQNEKSITSVLLAIALAAVLVSGCYFLFPAAREWVVVSFAVLTVVLVAAAWRISDELASSAARTRQEAVEAANQRGWLFDVSGDCIFVIKPDGRVATMNSAGWSLFGEVGIKRTEQASWLDIWDGDPLRAAEVSLATANAGGVGRFQALCMLATRRGIWLDVTLTPLGSVDGEILAVLRDISEVRAAEEKFNAMFEHSPDPHFLFDGNVILDCNHASIELLQFGSKAELLSRHADGLSPDVQPAGVISAVKREELWELAFQAGHFRYEWEARRADGSTLPVEIALTPMFLHGRDVLLAVWQDLSERRQAEAALKESEERFLAFMNHSPTLCVIKDEAGKILFINQRTAEAFHTTAEEMVGKTDFDWLPLEAARAVREYDHHVLESNCAAQRTEVISSGGGPEREWLMLKFPIVTPDRKLLGGIGVDIREQRRAERALKLSERQFRDLFDDAPVAYHELDRDGHITRVNATELALLGYTAKEMEGRSIWDFLVEQDLQNAMEKKIAGEIAPHEGYQCTFRRKDGTLVPTLVTDRLIRDGAGNVTGLRSTMQDISALKKAEEQSRIAAENYRKIFENATEGIYQSSPDGRFVTANPALAEIHGYTSSAELITDVRDIGRQLYVDPARRAEFRRLMSEHGAVSDFESQVFRKSGTIIWISEHARTVYDNDGSVLFYEGTVEDITARKEAERAMAAARDAALESARLKSEFLANMSHEIRTPMNGIIGMTGLLLEMNMPERQRDFTQTIADSAEALLKIINDILDFSKIEAGMMNFERIPFAPGEVAESVVDLFASRAQEKNLDIATLIHPDVPVHIEGDPGRLRQVLANFIGNAIKFTNSGHILIEMHTAGSDAESVTLRISVTDTGIGISDEEKARLFQPFVQADGSTTRRFGGTGLGLAISKRIISQMSGETGVISQPGNGSTFWFTGRFNLAKTPEPTQATPLANLRILLVENTTATRTVLPQLLGGWGATTTVTPNAAAASEASKKGAAFDIAMISSALPEAPKLSATLRKQMKSLRVVFITSLSGDDARPLRDREARIARPLKRSALLSALLGTTPSHETLHPAAPSIEPNGNLRILVGEDSPVNQKVSLHTLEKLGFTPHIVTDGEQVLAAARAANYDVILMDCQMPTLDGYEATRRIRQGEASNADGHRAWIIAMTAHSLPGDREKCIASGMDDYITKPVRISELSAALARTTPSPQPRHLTGDIVDAAALQSLRQLDDTGHALAGVIEVFLHATPAVLDTARNAVRTANARGVASAAHVLKGSCSNFGARRMQIACEILEELALNDDIAHAGAALAEIESEFALVHQALKHSLSSSATASA